MTQRSRWATVGGLLLIGLATTSSSAESAVGCGPTYLRLGEESAEVGHLTISTSWVLIGCRAELEALGTEGLDRARAELAVVSRELVWGLLTFEEDRELRKSVTKRLQQVTRRGIGDVLLVYYRIEE